MLTVFLTIGAEWCTPLPFGAYQTTERLKIHNRLQWTVLKLKMAIQSNLRLDRQIANLPMKLPQLEKYR